MRAEREDQEIKPEELPFYSTWPDDIYGEISYAEYMSPGVFYLRAKLEESPYDKEYYAVQDKAEAISKEARTYGAVIPGCPGVLLFKLLAKEGGKEIIEYEVERCRIYYGGLPQAGPTMHGLAVYGMELYPQYFGEFPVPIWTPMGYTCRHKRIDNGVYWIETDQCKICVAVCYPYCDEFSDAAKSLALQTDDDRRKGIDNTLGYQFFPEEVCCIPIFELMQVRDWDSVIDKAALMNAIWWHFPEYATSYNANEQTGRHDLLGMMRLSLGQEDVELQRSTEHMIAITPNAGTSFFKFS